MKLVPALVFAVAAPAMAAPPDGLPTRVARQPPAQRLDLSRLNRLQVASGQGHSVRRGAILGATVGAIFGVLVSSYGCVDDETGHCHGRSGPVVRGLAYGAVGACVGALIGSILSVGSPQPLTPPRRPGLRMTPAVTLLSGGAAGRVTVSLPGRRH